MTKAEALDSLMAQYTSMSQEEQSNIATSIEAHKGARRWTPSPGPQTDAYLCEADLLLYGGAAGGGKSDLLLGLAFNEHLRSVIFREHATELGELGDRSIEIMKTNIGYNAQLHVWRFDQGKKLEFGGLIKPNEEQKWRGRPHDFYGWDEAANLSAYKINFTGAWMRSTIKEQRCRGVIATNPPEGGEGWWMIEMFAPWLDPMFPDPAKPGELRWCVTVPLPDRQVETRWVEGPGEYDDGSGTMLVALSRTFIPAKLGDNPYLRDTAYRSRLDALPEPLRSALRDGNFMAAREDHKFQVIPTEWVNLAQARWVASKQDKPIMLAMGVDVAQGGSANTCLAPLYTNNKFDELIVVPGVDTKDGAAVGSLIVQHLRNGAPVGIDMTGGWGGGAATHLADNTEVRVIKINFSAASGGYTNDSLIKFFNMRADMWWRLREALDPASNEEIALPPDARLEAELTTPRFKLQGGRILIEDKGEIEKRLGGGSVDRGDSVVMAWSCRSQGIVKQRGKMGNVQTVVPDDDPYAEL